MTEAVEEIKTGADCSGSDGGSNRVLILENTSRTAFGGFLVSAGGLSLALTGEYTVSHKSASTEITFLNPLWDDMVIVVNYYQNPLPGLVEDFVTEYYTGADCSGNDGGSNRVLTLSNNGTTIQTGLLVYVSGIALTITTEYTIEHKSESTEITFLNPLWDDLYIIVNYKQDLAEGVGTDFINGPLVDFGVVATRTPVTMTTNFSGNKTYTDGTDENIEVVFNPYTKEYTLDKAGLTQVYDATVFIRPGVTLNKYDKITYDSKIYRVDRVSPRDFNGTSVFQVGMLFFVEDE